MVPFLKPDLHLHSVVELTPEWLQSLGIDSLLLDADCTLKEYHSEIPLPEVALWLKMVRQYGVGLCLVSNGRGPRIHRFAEKLGLPYVATAMKPLPFGCRRAVRTMQWDPKRTAMVGDQVFADVAAGRLAGLYTILVDPIRPDLEPWFTRLKRPFERCFVSRRVDCPAG